jgi:hypothetical protein
MGPFLAWGLIYKFASRFSLYVQCIYFTGLNHCHGLILQCAGCFSMINITDLFLNSVLILGMYV